jgi:hypothetical protein
LQAGFNSIVRPILTLNGNSPRGNRWNWFPYSQGNSTAAVVRLVDAGNVIFSGVPLGKGQNVTVSNIKVDVFPKVLAIGCNGYPATLAAMCRVCVLRSWLGSAVAQPFDR